MEGDGYMQGHGYMAGHGDGTIPVRVAELLCSRLCHDLISPVSALNNGMELLAGDPADMIADIADLLAFSAGQASQRLQFYRMAYGLSGDGAVALSLTDAARLVRGLGDAEKHVMDWPAAPGDSIGRDPTRLALNMAALGLEALPRGGRVAVSVARAGDGGRLALSVTAAGTGAGLRDEVAAALPAGDDVASLTARSVQAWYTGFLARRLGGECALDSGEGSVTLSADIAAAA